jgi:hypothetical protein
MFVALAALGIVMEASGRIGGRRRRRALDAAAEIGLAKLGEGIT